MPKPIFISYARATNLAAARTLFEAFGGADGEAFLDTTDIAQGEQFPRALIDAIWNARVFVALIDDAYFTRWMCLRELRTALAPVDALLGQSDTRSSEIETLLRHIVLAIPEAGQLSFLENLPAELRSTNWPNTSRTTDVVALIRQRLSMVPASIGVHLTTPESRGIKELFLSETALPPARRITSPHFPSSFPSSLNDRFVGRADDLFRIHFTLATLRGEPTSSASLSGSVEAGGGFGKTRLALEYVWRFGPAYYPGGIFWLTADQDEAGLESQFHGMLTELRPDTPPLPIIRESQRVLRQELCSALRVAADRGAVLFVVDNLPEANSEFSPRPIEDYCPALGIVTTLITTRSHLAEPSVRPLSIDVLNRAASISMLTAGTDQRGALTEDQWSAIAEWVGDLPLALEILNRALSFRAISPSELLSRAREESPTKELTRQMDALRTQIPISSLRGVAEALAISYESLTPMVRRTANLLSWFSSEPLPIELFRALGSDSSSGSVRTALIAHSIISPYQRSESGVEMIGTMHRIIADYIRCRVRTPRVELAKICTAILTVMTKDWCADPKQWPLMNACLPHASAVFWRVQSQEEVTFATQLNRLFRRAVRLSSEELLSQITWVGINIATLLLRQMALTEHRRFADAVVQFTQKQLGSSSDEFQFALLLQADGFREGGDAKRARTIEEEVVGNFAQMHGPGEDRTMIAKNNLAISLYQTGEPTRAQHLMEEVLAHDRELFGEGDRETITAMHNLSGFLRANGEIERAKALAQRAWDLYRQVMGEAHPDTLRTMGFVADDQDDPRQRIEMRRELLRLHENSTGLDHPMALNALVKYGALLLDACEYGEARRCFEDAVDRNCRVNGLEHTSTLTAQYYLARALDSLGEYAAARKLFEETLELDRRVRGPENRSTLTTMYNLALTLDHLGEYPRAKKLFEDTLQLEQQVRGPENPSTLTTMHHLALTLDHLGECAAARQLFEETLELDRRVRGPQHPRTLTTMHDLAVTLDHLGEYAAARQLFEETLELDRHVRGPEHPKTLITMKNLELTLGHLATQPGASKLLEASE